MEAILARNARIKREGRERAKALAREALAAEEGVDMGSDNANEGC